MQRVLADHPCSCSPGPQAVARRDCALVLIDPRRARALSCAHAHTQTHTHSHTFTFAWQGRKNHPDWVKKLVKHAMALQAHFKDVSQEEFHAHFGLTGLARSQVQHLWHNARKRKQAQDKTTPGPVSMLCPEPVPIDTDIDLFFPAATSPLQPTVHGSDDDSGSAPELSTPVIIINDELGGANEIDLSPYDVDVFMMTDIDDVSARAFNSFLEL